MSARDDLAASFMAAVFAHTERRPVSITPADGTYSVVDNGFGRSAAAVFKGGSWVRSGGNPLAFEPTHWLALKGAE